MQYNPSEALKTTSILTYREGLHMIDQKEARLHLVRHPLRIQHAFCVYSEKWNSSSFVISVPCIQNTTVT